MLLQHISLRTQCGICTEALVAGESFVPLTGSHEDGCPDSATFPDNVKSLAFGRTEFCWSPNCWRCVPSSEAVAVHSDCLQLFREEFKADEAIKWLWTAIVSRSPWPGAQNLRLGPDAGLAVEFVYEIAERFGSPGLRLLPPELIRMVRDSSRSGTFWRYISAMSFARELSAAPIITNPLPSTEAMPLSSVLSWKRGRAPVRKQQLDPHRIMRISIDSRGIKEVERLDMRGFHPQSRSDSMAFIIQEEGQVTDIMSQFKDSTLRLKMPKEPRGFHTWDMPSPPRLEDCTFCGHISGSMRFRTLDLRNATGLTFLFAFNKVYGIHAHTAKEPYATTAFDRLSALRKPTVVWAYLPIPEGEEIIAIGVRMKSFGERRITTQKPCFMIRTKLAGDLFLGQYHHRQSKDTILSNRYPRLLIYNTVDLGGSTTFGTYTPEPEDGNPLLAFPWPRINNVPHPAGNISSALLDQVTRIRVLNDQELGICRGILFDYENGACRAVGNCRLGLDKVTTYPNPSYICYRPHGPSSLINSHLMTSVQVESGSCSPHSHDGEGWVCAKMHGTLEFWFTPQSSVIKLIQQM